MTYSVVALRAEHPLAKDNRFHSIGSDLIRNSMWQTRPTSPPTPDEWLRYKEQFRYAEIFVLSEYSSKRFREMEEELEARFAKAIKQGHKGGASVGGFRSMRPEDKPEKIPISAEYQGYAKVYFLNEVAVQMYRDSNVEFEILKTIAAEELPENCSRCLRGPYRPQNNLNS